MAVPELLAVYSHSNLGFCSNDLKKAIWNGNKTEHYTSRTAFVAYVEHMIELLPIEALRER